MRAEGCVGAWPGVCSELAPARRGAPARRKVSGFMDVSSRPGGCVGIWSLEKEGRDGAG